MNPFVLPLLITHVSSVAAGPGITYLVDCFCGSGLFSLSLAARFQEVIGIEVSSKAVQCARENAVRNSIENASFVCNRVESLFENLHDKRIASSSSAFHPGETTVLMDPPRSGCDALFLDHLIVFRPRKIVYVACDLFTQARDAQIIINAGYKVESITPFDLFPQTKHVENVVLFSR